MITKPPAFQFYAKDIYTGTSDLSPAEFGTYVRGLVWSWDNGPLPLDAARRARVLLIDSREHAAIWPVIAGMWTATADGFVNARLEKQRADLAAHRQRQSEKGLKSATGKQPKAQPEGNRISTRELTGHQTDWQPEAQPEGNSSSSSASSSPIFGLQTASAPAEDQTRPRKKRAVSEPAYSPDFQKFWEAYPRKIEKAPAWEAFKALAPSDVLLFAMLKALDWQRTQPKWLEAGGKYILYPERWLKRRCWEDEPFHAANADPLAANDDVWAQVDALQREKVGTR